MAERPDWALFRTVEGLAQKAGVAAKWLRRLVLKELADNSLDAMNALGTAASGGGVTVELNDAGAYVVADKGPGLDGEPENIAALFSIRRPMRSSKLMRLPQRGALGNGLRVVAGAVLASGGSLIVTTRNRRITLKPQADGSTEVAAVETVDHETGTRVEISLGPSLPSDTNPFAWAKAACAIADQGKLYDGKSSPHWYDPVHFHELLLAHGGQPLRALIAQLDGCTGGRAGEVVNAAGLAGRNCDAVSAEEAGRLLAIARENVRPVAPERLGMVGKGAFEIDHYAVVRGVAEIGSAMPPAEIPYVVEAWAEKLSGESGEKDDIVFSVMVNRSRITAEVGAYRDSEKDLALFGAGLRRWIKNTPRKGGYYIAVNILTPYCPITSDGKAPDLSPFSDAIVEAIGAAMRKAQRAAPTEKRRSQKDVILENLDDIVAEVSGDGEFRFNERQIFYRMRPIIMEETGKELTIGNFKSIITGYEAEEGEILGMYREPRGSLYIPHRDLTITLGTLSVEEFERPPWTFNRLVYIEKEGFSEALKDIGWPERWDCAVMSSKGFSTRAARDLVDKLALHDEPCTVFAVHDADAFGTMIFQTLQEATRARGARKVEIVNLGLEPWEAVAAGLDVESVERGDKYKPVAQYVLDRPDGERWEEWLQTQRVELNVMTTPEFVAWLDAKMVEHDQAKLIPPGEVIVQELEAKLAADLREIVTERILREAGLDRQVAEALDRIRRPTGAMLAKGIRKRFTTMPESEWRDHITAVTERLLRDVRR